MHFSEHPAPSFPPESSCNNADSEMYRWASVAPREKIVNGAFYTPVGSKSSGSWLADDGKLAEEFWDWTEKEVESKGY